MFNNVKRLSDQQLDQVLQQVRSGDTKVLQALNLYSPIPLMAEKLQRKQRREEQEAEQMQANPEPVIDQLAGVGSLPVPGMMEEQNYAGGGIVAFAGGGSSGGYDYTNPYVPADILRAVHGAESTFGTANTKYGPMVSRAGATGHFQFMPGTAKQFGLSREDTYDFEKSKLAAAKYLAQLHNEFGNWEEALRAYNAGSAGYRAIKAGKSQSPENENYVGRIRKYLPEDGQTPLSQRGILRAGAGAGTGSDSQMADASGIAANYTAGRKEALEKAEQLRREREALLEKPEAPDTEGERKKMLEERAAFRKPFETRMDQMLAGMKPDTEKMSSSNANEALLKASLLLMGGRGKGISGALADVGAAGNLGLEAYKEGKRHIQNAQRDYDRAQMLGEQEKFKLAKGDYDAANDAATQSTRLYRTAMTEYNKGRETIARDHAANLRAVDQDFDARWKMYYEQARLNKLDEREARRIADQKALDERRLAAEEGRQQRNMLDAASRAMTKAQSKDVIDRYADEYRNSPEYRQMRDAKNPAREQYAMEYARKKALSEALAQEGITEQQYQELRRRQAGLGSLPQSAPAPAQAAPGVLNMDAAGNFTPGR